MKKSFKFLGVTLLSCSFLVGCNSINSGAIEESATDFLTHKSVKASSIVASSSFDVANTLSQAGTDNAGGYYLRYLTPFRVNSTANVSLKYTRTFGTDIKEVAVSSVYDSVKTSDGKILHYNGTELVEKTAESSSDWYIAAYTIKFDSTATGFVADALNYKITAKLTVSIGAESKEASKETSFNLNYDFSGQTIYFKSTPVKNGDNWAVANAGTAVILVDENNKQLNVEYQESAVIRELATYEKNPGYYQNTKYWSFTIDNSKAKKVKFVRTSSDGKDYWGAETDYISLSPLFNLYAIDSTQDHIWKGDSGYCTQFNASLVDFETLRREGIVPLYFKAPSNFSYYGTEGYINLWKDGQDPDAADHYPGIKMEYVNKVDNCNIWVIEDIDLSDYDNCRFVVWIEKENQNNGQTYTGHKHRSAKMTLSSRGSNNMFVSTNEWECTGSWTTYVA